MQFTIILDETKLPKFVHEKAHPGTSGPDHFSGESYNRTIFNSRCGREPYPLAVQCCFTKEMVCRKYADYRFLSTLGDDGDLHLADLNIKTDIHRIPVRCEGRIDPSGVLSNGNSRVAGPAERHSQLSGAAPPKARWFACARAHLDHRFVAASDRSACHAGVGGARSWAISDRMSANICRGTATSASWNVT